MCAVRIVLSGVAATHAAYNENAHAVVPTMNRAVVAAPNVLEHVPHTAHTHITYALPNDAIGRTLFELPKNDNIDCKL